jgi:opacity protein-like surface antigen
LVESRAARDVEEGTNMFKKMLLGTAVALAASLGTSAADASLYWTTWVSEEGGSPQTICSYWNEAATGFGCLGSYCDWVRLQCETMPFGTTLDAATDYWTPWFSEEHDDVEMTVFDGGYWYATFDEHYQICQYTGFPHGWAGLVSGARCSGSYCDNISLECTQPVKVTSGGNVKVNTTNCGWTANSYSEEQGSVDFGYNRYVVGAQCSGSYCDNKRYMLCSLVDPG